MTAALKLFDADIEPIELNTVQATTPTPATGPITPEGKARSRLNAMTHGALSKIVPSFEKAEYADHVLAVMDTYNPVGYIEERLADRIASSLWRLRRMERYEAAISSHRLLQVNAELHDPTGRHRLERLSTLKPRTEKAEAEYDQARKDSSPNEKAAHDQALELLIELRHVEQSTAINLSLNAIPPEEDMKKIARYEAHLERGLYRAMHELEALQDKRKGRAAPLARVEVHGLPEK